MVKASKNEEAYVDYFFGGKNCVRVTVPVITQEQIEKASRIFRELADDLDGVARDDARLLFKLMEARTLINRASLTLKGGIAYKGAR